MKKKLISIMTFILVCSTLYPLFSIYGKSGIFISPIIAVTLSIIVYFIANYLEDERVVLEEKFFNYMDHLNENNKVIFNQIMIDQKAVNTQLFSLIEVEKESSDELLKNLFHMFETIGKFEENLIEINRNSLSALIKINRDIEDMIINEEENNQLFIDKSILILDLLTKDIDKVNQLKGELLNKMDVTVGNLLDISADNKVIYQYTSNKLDTFTGKITELFESRIDNEYKAINDTRDNISNNLKNITTLVEKFETENQNYINNVDKKYEELFLLFNSSQNNFHNRIAQQIDNLSGNCLEIIETSESNSESILKKQARNSDTILDNIKEIQLDIFNQIKDQTEMFNKELHNIKELREELMNINATDIELIRKMLDGN